MGKHRTDAFTFFSSYYDGASLMDEADRKDFIVGLIDFAFTGKEPNFSGDRAKMAWEFVKPSVEAGVKNRVNGKKGGRPKKEKE